MELLEAAAAGNQGFERCLLCLGGKLSLKKAIYYYLEQDERSEAQVLLTKRLGPIHSDKKLWR